MPFVLTRYSTDRQTVKDRWKDSGTTVNHLLFLRTLCPGKCLKFDCKKYNHVFVKHYASNATKSKLEPQGALIAHLSSMSTSVIS